MDSKRGGGGEREVGAGQDGQGACGIGGLFGGEQWGGGGGQAGGDVAAEFIGCGARGEAFPLPLARAGNRYREHDQPRQAGAGFRGVGDFEPRPGGIGTDWHSFSAFGVRME